MRPWQYRLDLERELIVDNFAGGGGASTGIEMALGRFVDIAVNHDREALDLHEANHPQTRHLCEDVFAVDPVAVCGGRPVGLAWFSPDCKHFSKAKGGKPRDKRIRGLAWVVLHWVRAVRPRVIILENVEEFQTWGPCDAEGRPHKGCAGATFRAFTGALRRRGYAVEWRELRACDYGAPTIRKRFFLIARCDGAGIVWTAATHGGRRQESGCRSQESGVEPRKRPHRTAAECIDWSLPCHSIFLSKAEARARRVKRPLAAATLRRIARGVQRFVLETDEPFLVTLTHQGSERVHGMRDPFRTVTGARRGEVALGMPFVTEHANASSPRCFPADEPLRTQCAQVKGGHFALGAAFVVKNYGGNYSGPGSGAEGPLHTVTSVDHNGLAVAHVTKLRGTNIGSDAREPLHTVSAQGNHHAVTEAFCVKYYGNEREGVSLRDPAHTVTARDRLGVVQAQGCAVWSDEIAGMARRVAAFLREHGVDVPGEFAVTRGGFVIWDLGLRMLAPGELYRAQGFPEWYEFERMSDGRRLSRKAQVRMCGNSVCPPVAAALVRANVPELGVGAEGDLFSHAEARGRGEGAVSC